MMRNLIKNIIRILIFSPLGAGGLLAQYIPNATSYQYPGIKTLNALQPPTGCGAPSAANVPDVATAALYFDKCGGKWYGWDPQAAVWKELGGGGTGGNHGIFAVYNGIGLIKLNDSTLALDTAYTDARYLPNGLIQPGYVTWSGTGLIFNVTSAIYTINRKRYTSAANSIALDPANNLLPRYDAIAVDTLGQVVKITGIPGTNPSVPQVDPASQVFLTSVFVDAGATTPTQVKQNIIYDENTEPYTHTVTAGLTVNFDNTLTTYHGVKSMDVGTAITTKNIDFTSGAGNDTASNYTMLSIAIKLKDTLATNGNIRIQFLNGATAVSNAVILGTTNGFGRKNKTAYQSVMVPVSAFTFAKTSIFNTVRIQLTGTTNGFYVDYFQLQSGVPPATTVETDPIALAKTITVNGSTQALNNNPTFTVSGGITSESDPVAIAKTITVNGNTQALGNNPSFTVSGGTGGGIDSIRKAPGTDTVKQYSAGVGTKAYLTQRVYNIKDYGGKGDGTYLFDVSTTSGSATITSSSASFASGDVGKTILVNSAGSSGSVLRTTIASITNATTAVLALTASATITSDTLIYGSDNTSALQAAVNACANGGGGKVYAAVGIYLFSSALSGSGNAQVSIPINAGGTSKTKVFISIEGETVYGGSASGYLNSFSAASQTKGTIFYSTISGSGSIPSFIGSADQSTRNRNDFSISNLGIMVFSNHGASALSVTPINGKMFQKINATHNTISPDIEVNRTTSPAGSEVAGIIVSGIGDNGENMITENEIVGFKYGIVANEHTTLTGNLIFANIYGIAIPWNYHPVSGSSQVFACANEIYSPTTAIFGETAGPATVNLLVASEWDTASTIIPAGIWYKSVNNILDSAAQLSGAIRINIIGNGQDANSGGAHTYGIDSSKLAVSTFSNPYAFLNTAQVFTKLQTVKTSTNTAFSAQNASGNGVFFGKATSTGSGFIAANDAFISNFVNGDIDIYNNNASGSINFGVSAIPPPMTLYSSRILSLPGTSSLAIGTNNVTSTGGTAKFKIQVSPGGLPATLTDGTATLETYINNGNANSPIQFYTTGPYKLSFATNNGSPFLVLSADNTKLGVGTNAPAYTLDVNGTGHFSNTLNLAAGTTSIAPLNMPAGTYRTTPANGDIENNGSDLRYTAGGVSYYLQKATTPGGGGGGGGGTVTSFGKTDNWGIISSVTNPTTTPNYAAGVDSAALSGKYLRITDTATLLRKNTGANIGIDAGEQTYTGTFSNWVGTTPPSGTLTATYRWTQVGKNVTVYVWAKWATGGTAISGFDASLPADLPLPAEPTPLNSVNDVMYTGVSNINGALAANGKSALIKTGTGTYKFQALGSSAAFTKLSFSIGYLAQ